jgi:hypothetical protein
MTEPLPSPYVQVQIDLKLQIDVLKSALNNILKTGKSLRFARDIYFVIMDLEEALKEANETAYDTLN